MAVCIAQCIRHFTRDLHRVFDGKLDLTIEEIPQGFALHVGHGVEQKSLRLPGVVQRQYAGMMQTGSDLDLAQEAVGADDRRQFGLQHLERHLAAVLQVLGQIDRRHAAAPQLPLDSVALGEGGREMAHLLAWIGHGVLLQVWVRRHERARV